MGGCEWVVHGPRPGWAFAFRPADLRVLVPRSGAVSGSALVLGAVARRVYRGSGSFRFPRFHEEPAFSHMVPRSFEDRCERRFRARFKRSARSAPSSPKREATALERMSRGNGVCVTHPTRKRPIRAFRRALVGAAIRRGGNGTNPCFQSLQSNT